MKSEFINRYKLSKNSVEKAIEYNIALKNDREYEDRVDKIFIQIAELFINTYKGVTIEPPREREKSIKSTKNKVEKMEVERLSKLCAVEEISEEEKEQLYKLLEKRIEIGSENTKEKVKSIIKDIICGENINFSNIDKLIKYNGISDNTKTAILRVLVGETRRNDIYNKNEILDQLDKKYGMQAAIRENNVEKNLIRWQDIRKILSNKNEMERLKNSDEYLKAKDIRGMKIVIGDIPRNLETNDEKLKELLETRDTKSGQESIEYEDFCRIELANDFANRLINNEELLKKLNIELIPDGYKHKAKSNGYEAEHIKFRFRDKKEYVFELQLKSIYREDLSRLNGSASHEKRFGKKRVFPDTSNREEFIKNIQYTVPKYKILIRDEDKFKLHKCSELENTIAYYQEFIDPTDEIYKKIEEYIKSEETEKSI